ncbi:MAG: hypothetical protein AAF533_06760 [Acidobacteriota bacterium]
MTALWLPILLSGIAVFFLSYLAWMVLPHHRGDYSRLPDEDGTMEALRSSGVGAGQYSFPHGDGPEAMKDPAWQEKYNTGPSGFLLVRPSGPPNIGASMGISLGYNLLISAFVAYLASRFLDPGASFMGVFRLCATVAFLGYSGALGWGPIWQGKSWGSTIREVIDGLVYGMATGAIFAYFWPAA